MSRVFRDRSEESRMKTTLTLSSNEDAHLIKNFWPLYVHDIAAYEPMQTNTHGLLGVGESIETIAQQCDELNTWWGDPKALFPHLIRIDGVPAGFNLVASRSRLPEGIDADFIVHEFFLTHSARSSGAAEGAAIAGFELHRGKWEVVTWPTHDRAIAFWRRVLGRYKEARNVSEAEVDHPFGRRVAFQFENG